VNATFLVGVHEQYGSGRATCQLVVTCLWQAGKKEE
jgi:hypothetical protein